ncbi:hypothetical protein [Comamonas sp. GB3 AK4-5]|uniref:hypothetical protein n=1 Tax=Comamonas sp. GB3 AK4-5 TaxID=3231487 RepID=UPI00351DC31C
MSLHFSRCLFRFLRRLLLGLGAVVVVFVGWRIAVLATASAPRHADIVQQVLSSQALPAFTPQHLQLLRALRVWWLPVESGAPGVDPAQPLRGEAPAVQMVQQLLATEDAALATRRLVEVARWVLPFVERARLAPGRYAVPEDMQALLPGVCQGQFTLRAEHLTLLRAAMWNEVDGDSLGGLLAESTEEAPLWPMPYIDGKRPYGDRSYYTIDMAELLGRPFALDVQGRAIIPADRDAQLTQLHEETLTALQVLLLYGELDS